MSSWENDKNHLQHSQDDRCARRVTSWGSKVASTPHICPMTTAHMDDITALGVMCFSWKPAMECDFFFRNPQLVGNLEFIESTSSMTSWKICFFHLFGDPWSLQMVISLAKKLKSNPQT